MENGGDSPDINRRKFLRNAFQTGVKAGTGLLLSSAIPSLRFPSNPDILSLLPESYTFSESANLPPVIKDKLIDLVKHHPKIDDPKDADKQVLEGYGYASFHSPTDIMIPIAANNWDRYVENGEQPIENYADRVKYLQDMLDPESNKLTPQQALDQKKVVGFMAMRGNESAGKRYLLATVDQDTHQIKYLGIIYTIDCADPKHYLTTYSRQKFAYGPYRQHPQSWLAEASAEIYTQLPNVRSPEGKKPGLIMIQETRLRELLAK